MPELSKLFLQQKSGGRVAYSVQRGPFEIHKTKLESLIWALWASVYNFHHFCCYHLVSLLNMGPCLWLLSHPCRGCSDTLCFGFQNFISFSLQSQAHHAKLRKSATYSVSTKTDGHFGPLKMYRVSPDILHLKQFRK